MRRIPVFLKKFDKYGNPIESSRLFPDGSSKTWTSTYTYDSKGNWTKRVNFTDAFQKHNSFEQLNIINKTLPNKTS
jgi:hypothetical protein